MAVRIENIWKLLAVRPLTALLLAPIRLYQKFISPLFGPRCRYYPSCSKYAQQAITTHGPVKGILLATGRILRCHPWTAGGIDPIPNKGSWRSPKVIEVSTNEDRQVGQE